MIRARPDAFWPNVVHACAPLAIWAGHFFACYAFVAVGCRAQLDHRTAAGMPLLTLGLLLLTVAALAWLSLILADAAGILRRRSTQLSALSAGATAFRSGAALMSLAAVAWTTAPILLFSSCLQ